VWTGFLLRSAAVADWPGLRALAYADDARTKPLALLRLDRLSPTVLIAIFDGIAARFELAEPPQVLHAGVQRAAAPNAFQVPLRGIGGTRPAGLQLEGAPAPITYRDDARRVVDVLALHRTLADHLAAAYDGPLPPLGPAAFAIQLGVASVAQPFVHDGVTP
jgi:hypothetical protein